MTLHVWGRITASNNGNPAIHSRPGPRRRFIFWWSGGSIGDVPTWKLVLSQPGEISTARPEIAEIPHNACGSYGSIAWLCQRSLRAELQDASPCSSNFLLCFCGRDVRHRRELWCENTIWESREPVLAAADIPLSRLALILKRITVVPERSCR